MCRQQSTEASLHNRICVLPPTTDILKPESSYIGNRRNYFGFCVCWALVLSLVILLLNLAAPRRPLIIESPLILY